MGNLSAAIAGSAVAFPADFDTTRPSGRPRRKKPIVQGRPRDGKPPITNSVDQRSLDSMMVAESSAVVDEDAVVEIALALEEPNIELVSRVVTALGRKESFRLMNEAQQLNEQPGGVLIFDGSRRKTPGGLFLGMVKKVCVLPGQFEAIFLPSFVADKQPVEEAEAEASNRDESWCCEACTTRNPFMTDTCEMCETPHPQAADPKFIRACGVAQLRELFPTQSPSSLEAALDKAQGLVTRAANLLHERLHARPETPPRQLLDGPGPGWSRGDGRNRPTSSQEAGKEDEAGAETPRLIALAELDVWCTRIVETLAMSTGKNNLAQTWVALAEKGFRVPEAMSAVGIVELPTPPKPGSLDHQRSDGERLRVEAAGRKREASRAYRAASKAYEGEDHSKAKTEARVGAAAREESTEVSKRAAQEVFWENNGYLRTPLSMDCHGLRSGEVAEFIWPRLALLSALSKPEPLTLDIIVGVGGHSTLRATMAPAVEAVLVDLGVSFRYTTKGVLSAKVPAQLQCGTG